MVDYVQDISGSTSLMIRDLGAGIEFWMKTGSSTYNYAQPWSYGANGGNSGPLTFRMLRGGGWQFMGSVTVLYDQDVRLSIVNSGLGFPSYDMVRHIQRTTVPGAPYIWNTIAESSTHILVEFSDGYDGGSAIVERQIGYGSNPYAPEAYWASSGSSSIGPFASGDYKYFWARTRNAIGWSEWSNRTEKGTWRAPDAPYPVWVKDQTQTTAWTRFDDAYDGATPIIERQLGYGKNPGAPTNFAGDISGVQTITGLDPGQKYYFWGRVRNAVGWSPWSERRSANLVAGARVIDGGVWYRAVPYIRVSGVWRVAEPWVRDAGEWKQTSV